MANRNKHVRRSKKRSADNMTWIVVALIGGAVVVVAAIALLAQGNNRAGQKAFDSNFEPTFTDGPRVEVLPQDTIDYGDVKLGATINTVFTVRNIGDEPLIVLGEPQVEVIEGC